jgi:hypothetical protein
MQSNPQKNAIFIVTTLQRPALLPYVKLPTQRPAVPTPTLFRDIRKCGLTSVWRLPSCDALPVHTSHPESEILRLISQQESVARLRDRHF